MHETHIHFNHNPLYATNEIPLPGGVSAVTQDISLEQIMPRPTGWVVTGYKSKSRRN
jgi:hypothetical protein